MEILKAVVLRGFVLVTLFASCHSIALDLDRVGNSYVQFPTKPSDKVIILDDLPDTDVYQHRTGNEYDLVFNFDIRRYIGDKAKLLEHGLMEPTAYLNLIAFDVDTPPPGAGESFFYCLLR
jgi:hypothetical protein